VDTELIADPLRQIVPSLLDVAYAVDDTPPRHATDGKQLETARQQDASEYTTTPEPIGEKTQPADTLYGGERQDVNNADGLTAQSVDELPVESTLDTLSVPDVVSEPHSGIDVVVGDTSDGEQT